MVKLKTDQELMARIEDAIKRVKNMTPEEYEAMHKAQRESWARANVRTGDPRFD